MPIDERQFENAEIVFLKNEKSGTVSWQIPPHIKEAADKTKLGLFFAALGHLLFMATALPEPLRSKFIVDVCEHMQGDITSILEKIREKRKEMEILEEFEWPTELDETEIRWSTKK